MLDFVAEDEIFGVELRMQVFICQTRTGGPAVCYQVYERGRIMIGTCLHSVLSLLIIQQKTSPLTIDSNNYLQTWKALRGLHLYRFPHSTFKTFSSRNG